MNGVAGLPDLQTSTVYVPPDVSLAEYANVSWPTPGSSLWTIWPPYQRLTIRSFVGVSAVTVTLIVDAGCTAKSVVPQPVSVTSPVNCCDDGSVSDVSVACGCVCAAFVAFDELGRNAYPAAMATMTVTHNA